MSFFQYEKGPTISALIKFFFYCVLVGISMCFPYVSIIVGTCSASSHIHLSRHIHPPPKVCVCLSDAYSPLCHFRVVSMRCRNLQISSFGPQHIRQDYPQAACSLSPCLSASSATAHQADRGAVHLTPAAFQGFSSLSHPTVLSIRQPVCYCLGFNQVRGGERDPIYLWHFETLVPSLSIFIVGSFQVYRMTDGNNTLSTPLHLSKFWILLVFGDYNYILKLVGPWL